MPELEELERLAVELLIKIQELKSELSNGVPSTVASLGIIDDSEDGFKLVLIEGGKVGDDTCDQV